MNGQYLIEQICDHHNLQLAWNKVYKNGGGPGGDGITLNEAQKTIGRMLTQISREVREGQYSHSSFARYHIPKKTGGVRTLNIPSVRDRILHTNVTMTLSPILEPEFEASSFAYRPGRSIKQAVAAIERWRNMGYQHVIDADIKNYFGEIRHSILIETLARHLKGYPDADMVVDLVSDIMDNQGIALETLGKGIAQGSPLSPLLANLYLDYLDEKIEQRGIRIVRFADDFVILCKSLKKAEYAYEHVQRILEDLHLQLNPEKTRLVDFERGFEFIGSLFVRSLVIEKTVPEGLKAQGNTAPPNELLNTEAPHSPAEPLAAVKGRTDYAKGDRILYVLEPNRQIAIDDRTIQVLTASGQFILGIHCERVERIEVGPWVIFYHDFVRFCLAERIQVIFLDGWGGQHGRLVGIEDQNAALHFHQAQSCATISIALVLAKATIDARIRNQRTQLFRLNRRPQIETVKATLMHMRRNLRKLEVCETVQQVRGIEGASAALFWPALGALCDATDDKLKRSRPAKDPLNAVINYLTFMLERDIRSAARSAGLHVGFGFLHSPNDHKDAAVYDLMEPFRAPLTEGLAIYLFNSRRIKPDMFDLNQGNVVWMDRHARRAAIVGYENYVAKQINIPKQKKKLSWRRMMWFQAVSLAKCYRAQNTDLFIPYIMEP